MNSSLFPSNAHCAAILADGKRLASLDAVTLLGSGFKIAAKQMVKDYDLDYLSLVEAGLSINNSVSVSKAEALELLDLLSTEKARLLALRESQRSAYSEGK